MRFNVDTSLDVNLFCERGSLPFTIFRFYNDRFHLSSTKLLSSCSSSETLEMVAVWPLISLQTHLVIVCPFSSEGQISQQSYTDHGLLCVGDTVIH